MIGDSPVESGPQLVTSDSSSTRVRTQRRERRHGTTSRSELREQIAALRRQRLTLGVTAGVATISALVLGWMAIGARTSSTEAQARLADVQAARIAAERSLKLAETKIGQLVENRIPGLRKLELDRPLSVNADHVRDITFTRIEGIQTAYEYKAVVENGSTEILEPALEVLLFDELGVQVGRFEVEELTLEGTQRPPSLRPGEIRSFFSVVKLDVDREPVFFLLLTKPGGPDLGLAPISGLFTPRS